MSDHGLRERGGAVIEDASAPTAAIPLQVVKRRVVDADPVEVTGLVLGEKAREQHADHDPMGDHDDGLSWALIHDLLERPDGSVASLAERLRTLVGEVEFARDPAVFLLDVPWHSDLSR